MARTVNRTPASVDVPSKYYDTYFNQTSFTGINDNKNDINIDQQSFADAENVYIDTSERLVSRPPIEIVIENDMEKYPYVIDEWWFDNVHIMLSYVENGLSRYYRLCADKRFDAPADNVSVVNIINVTGESKQFSDGKYRYIFPEHPKCSPVVVENKVFFFVKDGAFKCFDLSEHIFEDAVQYIYVPITQLVINGIAEEFDTRNILTDTHKVRYQYSVLSAVDFKKLIGKHLSVSNQANVHLYDIDFEKGSENTLIYPAYISGEYIYDIVEAQNIDGTKLKIFSRYDKNANTIEISLNGTLYRMLPQLNGTPLKRPQFTEDGFGIVVFLPSQIAICEIAKVDNEVVTFGNFLWTYMPYFRTQSSHSIDSNFLPNGIFKSIEHFAYFAKVSGNVVLYIEYPDKDDTTFYYEFPYNDKIGGISAYSGIKVDMYVAPPTASDQNRYFLFNCVYDYVIPDNAHLNVELKQIIIRLKGLNNNYIVNTTKNYTLQDQDLSYNIRLCDLENMVVKICNVNETAYTFSSKIAYSIRSSGNRARFANIVIPDNYSNDVIQLSSLYTYNNDVKDNKFAEEQNPVTQTQYFAENNASHYFRVSQDGRTVITEKYVYSDFQQNSLPKIDSDTTYTIQNGMEMSVFMKNALGPEKDLILRGNIHRVDITVSTTECLGKISKEPIVSGCTVAYLPKNSSGDISVDYILNYMGPLASNGYDSYKFSVYQIYKMIPNEEGTQLIEAPEGTQIVQGDYIKMYSLGNTPATTTPFVHVLLNDGTTYIPIRNDSNYNYARYRCLSIPNTQVSGNVWPQVWLDDGAPPVSNGALNNSNIVYWSSTDTNFRPLDEYKNTRQIIYGIADYSVNMPIYATDDGYVWYITDDRLWTSELNDKIVLNLDELVDDNDGDIVYNPILPEHTSEMNEVFISLQNEVFVSEAKYTNKDGITDYTTQKLLYFPEGNKKKFSGRITNLHLIADTQMGIFFEDETWLCEAVTVSDVNAYLYTKSRLPIGCREGDEIITSIDGQYLIVARENGLSAIQPQQFMATTDQMISLLSTSIETSYNKFYKENIENAVPNYIGDVYNTNDTEYLYKIISPNIKMLRHKYWHMFYKYYGHIIYLLDMRTGAWWKWKMPLPIRKITSRDGILNLLLQCDYITGNTLYTQAGICFTLKEYKEPYTDVVSISVTQRLSGDFKLFEYGDNGIRIEREYAKPEIDWHITSQKLHFNAINNYKQIKQLNTICSGEVTQQVRLKTIAYRDITHPEKNIVVENKINDLKTFITRMNLMHIQFFQYELGADLKQEVPVPLQLDALNIKYGVKERIR